MSSAQHRFSAVWQRLGVPGRVAVGAIALACLVFLVSSRGLIRAGLATAPAGSGAQDSGQEQIERFKKSFDSHIAQIDGRSLFFTPSAPPPKPVATSEPQDSAPKGPTIPTRYEGPGIIGLGSDFVFFSDGKRVKVGEESGSVKVKSVQPPWGATLLWEGGEFTVSLFDRDRVVLPADREKTAAPPEKPAASIPEKTPTAPASEQPAATTPTNTPNTAPKAAENKS